MCVICDKYKEKKNLLAKKIKNCYLWGNNTKKNKYLYINKHTEKRNFYFNGLYAKKKLFKKNIVRKF
jgi:hypothetical protein